MAFPSTSVEVLMPAFNYGKLSNNSHILQILLKYIRQRIRWVCEISRAQCTKACSGRDVWHIPILSPFAALSAT